jgi:hypothetical protein
MVGFALTVENIIAGDKMVVIRDPVSGKITGNKKVEDKSVEFPEDKKAEEKIGSFTLTDVESKGEEPVKGKGGRPKGIHTPLSPEALEARTGGKKKKFNKNDYKDNPICQLINVTTSNTINKTVLATALKKMTIEDMQKISFGESMMYVIDYYAPKGLDTDHPIVIMLIAILGLGMKVVELKNITSDNEKAVVL